MPVAYGINGINQIFCGERLAGEMKLNGGKKIFSAARDMLRIGNNSNLFNYSKQL
jgi:hypothetical protein